MKNIGIIDYYVSEWHAYKYYSILDDACKAVGEDFRIAYAYGELDVSPYDGLTTQEWCEKHGAVKCESIEELCEKSDYIMILAPSNPETHLKYARAALRYGKNTFIDKTFAPDLATAKEIYRIADEHGTKIFSSSALRYATELETLVGARSFAITGGGSNLPEYIIHQAEMLIKLVGGAPDSIKAERNGEEYVISVAFPNSVTATMTYGPQLTYSAAADGGEAVAMKSPYFNALITDALRFFLTGEPSFPREETLAVAHLREEAIRCAEIL